LSTMKAAVLEGLADINCREVATPEAEAGRVLVRMLMSSICGTDLHYVFHGWPRNNWPLPPGSPGHEGVGVVIDGGGTEFNAGQRVLTVPNIWEARNFAEIQLVSAHFLIPLPDTIDLAHVLMAQQLGTVIFAARELPVLNGETVAVLGQGSAGLFHDFWLKRIGAGRVITVEPNRDRREAGRMFDVDDTIDVTGQDAINAVLELTDGAGADLIVDAVGGNVTLNQAVKMAKANGHIHIFGLPTTHDLVPFDLGMFFLKRLNATSTFGAQDEPGLLAFREALGIIERGEIDMAPFVTHVFALEGVKDAFTLAHEPAGGALKVSLSMQ
jgi:L-iditol 2-dehydrogenase